jgi:hypothetical protein
MGNVTVVLSTTEYMEKFLVLMDYPGYKKPAKDSTQSVEQKNTLLLTGSSLPEDVA